MQIAELSLTNICNFACSYCTSEASYIRARKGKNWSYAGPVVDFSPWLKFIQTHLAGYIILVTGGEPLIVQNIAEFLNDVSTTNGVFVNTNGANLQSILPLISESVKFRVSLHPDSRRLSEFRAVVSGLATDRVLINYMAHPSHLDSRVYFECVEFLKGLGKPYEVTAFEGSFAGRQLSCTDQFYFGLTTTRVTMAQEFKKICIHPDGRVFPCHGETAQIGDVYANALNISAACNNRCRYIDESSLCPIYDPAAKLFHKVPTINKEVSNG